MDYQLSSTIYLNILYRHYMRCRTRRQKSAWMSCD